MRKKVSAVDLTDDERHQLRTLLSGGTVRARMLNQMEIEWSVLARQCLERRIADTATLAQEIRAGEGERNAAGTTVDWRFGVDEARTKLARLSPA